MEIDLVGPISPQSVDGHTYIFTAICPFSRYVILPPLFTKTANEVASTLVSIVLLRFGCATNIRSDRGCEFINEIITTMLDMLSVTHNFSTAYHPQSQGAVERFHGQLNDSLAILSKQKPANWHEFLPTIAFTHNTAPIAGFNEFTPFFLIHGFTPRFPFDSVTATITSSTPINEYAKNLASSLHQAHSLVKQIQEDKQIAQSDKRAASHEVHTFALGSLVLLRRQAANVSTDDNVSISARLLPRWDGPFVVTRKAHPTGNAYYLGHRETKSEHLGFQQPINGTRLLAYEALPPPPHIRGIAPSTRLQLLVKTTSGERGWFTAEIISYGSTGLVEVKWDNDDPNEWLDLSTETYQWLN